MAKAVWGMDIGNTAIKVVRARRSGAGIEVVDFDIEEIAFDEDDGTRMQRVREALLRLASRKPIGVDPVYVSIPGNQTFFRAFALPDVEERRVEEIVQYEARQQIPFRLDEVLWGYKYHRTEEGEMQISLVAVRREVVQEVLDACRSAGINVEGVASSPVALYNFTVFEYRPEVTTIVLDAGSRVTDFVVVDGDAFWMRPIPAGSAEMVRTLRQKFRIPQQEAENLLIKMDQSKQSEKMFQIIEPIIRNLAGDIQRSLGFYKSLSRNVRIERVIGLGGAFKVPQVREFVGRALGQQLEAAESLRRFQGAPGLDVGWLEDEAASLAVALGLTVQGVGLASADINLLPEEVVKQKLIGRKKPWAVFTAAAVLLAVLLSFYATRTVVGGYQGAVDQADEIIEEVKRHKIGYNKAQTARKPLEDRLKYYSRIGRERLWYLDCLNKVNAALLQASPRRKLLPGTILGDGPDLQPKLYIRQLYVSRYNWETCMTPRPLQEEEEGSGFGRPRRPAGGGGFAFPGREGIAHPEFGRDGLSERVPDAGGKFEPDIPMKVVLVGEVMGTPGSTEVRFEDAFPLREALRKVDCFKDVDFLPRRDRIKVLAVSPKKLKKLQEEGEEHMAYRYDLVFKLVWRYDDGSDITEDSETTNE